MFHRGSVDPEFPFVRKLWTQRFPRWNLVPMGSRFKAPSVTRAVRHVIVQAETRNQSWATRGISLATLGHPGPILGHPGPILGQPKSILGQTSCWCSCCVLSFPVVSCFLLMLFRCVFAARCVFFAFSLSLYCSCAWFRKFGKARFFFLRDPIERNAWLETVALHL